MCLKCFGSKKPKEKEKIDGSHSDKEEIKVNELTYFGGTKLGNNSPEMKGYSSFNLKCKITSRSTRRKRHASIWNVIYYLCTLILSKHSKLSHQENLLSLTLILYELDGKNVTLKACEYASAVQLSY